MQQRHREDGKSSPEDPGASGGGGGVIEVDGDSHVGEGLVEFSVH